MDKPELQGIRLLEQASPVSDELVVAEVLSFTDELVNCSLLMYNKLPAILPTRHINIRRGRRVKDYVKVGQILVASVYSINMIEKEDGLQVQQIDLSIKSIQEDEKTKTMEQYHRACKVHQIICAAANYKRTAVDYLYTELRSTVKPIQEDQPDYDLYAYLQDILVGDQPCENEPLCKAIQQRMEMPSHTVSKDYHFQTSDPNGVKLITERLNHIAAQPGIKVFVVASPHYRITATAASKRIAEQLLAAV